MLDVSYPIARVQLDNGLAVLASHDPLAPGIAVNLWYAVGSADDPAEATGLAHLFEHLMFAGSAGVASGEHLALVESLGGSANATTSFDRTNYYETLPVHAFRLALWLEADRLGSLTLDQGNFDTQRSVVQEEKRQRFDNVPYGDQLALLLKLNFPSGHPYARPPIGSMAHLDAASLSQTRAFHQAWYRPDRASLVVVGPLADDEVFAQAERYLGRIPLPGGPGGTPAPVEPLPPHEGVPRLRVQRNVPSAAVHLCWRTPPLGHADEDAVALALDILAAGQACRLHRTLVRDKEAAEAVGVNDFGLARGTSLSCLVARPRAGHDLDELEEAMLDAVRDLGRDGPSAQELDRAQAAAEREWFSQLATIDTRADQLNEDLTLLGDPGRINRRIASLHAVTAEDVAHAAATWLDPSGRAVLDYETEVPA
ncbi:MAG: insulinase family protein [Actinomycetia bacterium]|nr:insulinase family protein [Actinomycetes bacterium]